MNSDDPYQRNLMRMRGFSAGAGARPMDPEREKDSDYVSGYVAGQSAKRTYGKISAEELNLRLSDITLLQ